MDFLIYGKIIIDDIRLANGQIVRGILGGGGPQAAFGARLWSDSIGFLTRSGIDMEEGPKQTLYQLDIDLQGWHKYPDIPTPRTRMIYDDDEYLVSEDGNFLQMVVSREEWQRLLAQELTLPAGYQQPKAIHLITEFYDEPMVQTALALQAQGAILSLEPLIDFRGWRNKDRILEFISLVDIVSPDWPSASGIAESDDPKTVLEHWSKLGPSLVAIRDGARGSYVWDARHDQYWHIPIIPVEVVDPTGAGNSYSGGLCVGWIQHGEARMAGCQGGISAKFLVEQAGLPPMSEALQAEAQRLRKNMLSLIQPL